MIPKIVVVGSLVYDLVVFLQHFPRKGETLLASNFKMFAGGKGFNQAVAARRCGAQVGMVGKVGGDYFGDTFLEIMDREGIDCSFVKQDRATSTSLAIPMIDPQGDNSIIGVPRANTLVRMDEVNATKGFIENHHVLLLQMEIPLAASLQAARIAHEVGLTVMLNPAPVVAALADFLITDDRGSPIIDWLIPNEVEAEMLSGMPVRNPEEALEAGRTMLAQGVGSGVVITLGAQGSVAVTHTGQSRLPAIPVHPVDPTGAGDAFCGCFATAMAEGQALESALKFANAAGALAVTQAGAEPSLPGRANIETFLRLNGGSG